MGATSHFGVLCVSRVSLVMGSVDRIREPLQFVESLARQRKLALELIIVDQNTDDRLAPVEARASALGIKVTRISEGQRNLSHARNVGIVRAAGDIIGFPDDDCWYEPDVIEQVERCFAANPQFAALCGAWFEAPDELGESGPLDPSALRRFRAPRSNSILLFIRREVLVRLGGFDPRLGTGQWFGAGEETDLVMRLSLSGSAIRYAPEVVIHHPYPTGIGGLSGKDRSNIRSRARGTGALYAKLGLSAEVVIRGCLSPLVRSLLPPYRLETKQRWLAQALGRMEGLVAWHWKYGRGKPSWTGHADEALFTRVEL